jgi:hypothetical protein
VETTRLSVERVNGRYRDSGSIPRAQAKLHRRRAPVRSPFAPRFRRRLALPLRGASSLVQEFTSTSLLLDCVLFDILISYASMYYLENLNR